MAIDLNSAGVTLRYASATGGARPTSGYTTIPGIKSIPDLNPEPSSLDATTLENLEYKSYIPGLKDTGGAIQFGANNTEAFHTAWSTMLTAAGNDGILWFAVVIPNLTKAFYFSGTPSPLGLSAIEVDSVLEISPYITPKEVVGWEAKPTGS